jgi:ABC-2 type transport system permease protein
MHIVLLGSTICIHKTHINSCESRSDEHTKTQRGVTMNRLSILSGSLTYEFRMQIRRPALWITFILLGLLLTQFHQPWSRPISSPASDAIIYWTGIVQSFLVVVVGIFLADRLPRDRRLKVDEVLSVQPARLGARLAGKYLGATLATLVPLFVVYSVGVGYILYRWHNLAALPIALATFATIALPGIFFVAAFSLACPAIMWVPLYQFLFVGYWFWGNLLPPVGIPTLSTTILTPVGGYMCTGFFNQQGHEGVCSPGIQGATALQGLESILLLLSLALLVLLVLTQFIRWRQARL